MGRIKQMLRSYGSYREELFRELVSYVNDIDVQIVDKKWALPAHLKVNFEPHPNRRGIRTKRMVARFSTVLFNDAYSIDFMYFALLHEYGHAVCFNMAESKFANGHNSALIVSIEELTSVKRSVKQAWSVLSPFLQSLCHDNNMTIRESRTKQELENEICASLLACFILNPLYLHQADGELYEAMLGKALLGDYGANYRKMTMINQGFNGDDFTTCLQKI